MKKLSVLIDSYNLICQNSSGGVRVRIDNFIKSIEGKIDVKKFDKWNDRIADFDLVHIFKSSSENYSMLKYAKENHIPVVVSSVVPAEKRFVIKINHILGKLIPVYPDRYLNEMVLSNADALFAQTEKEKKFIVKNFKINPQKIYVIPNGISIEDVDLPENYFEDRTGIPSGFVLQVGRFDNNKNQLNVIRAVKNTDICLVFIGGPDKNDPGYYEECVKEAGSNVHFLGWVDHNDPLLQSAYKAAHTVILPSFKEIFGNSLMEGGACGANLIVSAVLPVEEWGLDKYCLKINANDVSDIKRAIELSIKTEKSETISNYVRNQFSWDSVTDRHIEIYKKVLSDRGMESVESD